MSTPRQFLQALDDNPDTRVRAAAEKLVSDEAQAGLETVQKVATEVSSRIQDLLQRAALEIRDPLEALLPRVTSEAISAEEANDQLKKLETLLASVEAERAGLADGVALAAKIEADPAGWVDGLYQRTPALRRPALEL